MDDTQIAFATQYPIYGFDLDIISFSAPLRFPYHSGCYSNQSLSASQRPMDAVGGPDTKKARWSPNSFGAPTTNRLVTPTSRDAFANYGYGSQAGIPQAFSNGSPPSGFSGLL
ncbi:hypothetical protein EDB85DRAFT_1927795, partial [Lactarius pseudohatsudake]